MMSLQPVTIYETVGPATPQTTITDVLLGAAVVVLGLAALAVGLGAVLAGMLILFRRFRGRAGDGTSSDVTGLGLGEVAVVRSQKSSAAASGAAAPTPSDRR